MLRYGLAVTLLVALAAANAWAEVPDPAHCVVDSAIINACPYNHVPGTTDAEQYVDVVIVLYTTDDNPVENWPATSLQYTVIPHTAYPQLGGGTSGPCPNCEDHYTVTPQAAQTNALGEITLRVSVGPACSPSYCCPVLIQVNVVGQGPIPRYIQILQNTHDMVANGDVRGPDFSAFSSAYSAWAGPHTRGYCADFVWVTSPVPQTGWGEVTGPDFSAFSVHYTDCCGHMKENTPANCDPWTDACP